MAERGLRKAQREISSAEEHRLAMTNRRPVRVFEGTQRPYEAFWRVVDEAESESGEAEIQFYGYISEYSWFGDEVTPQLFAKDLKKLGGRPVTVRIHSGGGEVFAASAIRAMIMEYPGRVTCRIDGLCASAATYVATAADVVKMQDSAFFMVHDPWILAMGSAEELKTAARMLETIKDGIVETYQAKTHREASELERWMSKETWFTAREAMEAGFVDEVVSAPAGKRMDSGLADRMAVANAIRDYGNVPEEVRRAFLTKDTKDGTKDLEVTTEVVTTREEFECDPSVPEAVMAEISQEADGAAIEMGGSPVREDVAEEGGASETPEAGAEVGGAQGEGDPSLPEQAAEDGSQEAEGAANEMGGSPVLERAVVDEREVKSLCDYIEVFG